MTPIAPTSSVFCMKPNPHSCGTLTKGVIPAEIAVIHICEASWRVMHVCSRSMKRESYPAALAMWTISPPRQIFTPKAVQIFPAEARETRLLLAIDCEAIVTSLGFP